MKEEGMSEKTEIPESSEVMIQVPARKLDEWFERLADIAEPQVKYSENQVEMLHDCIWGMRDVAAKLLSDISMANNP
jgi:hypothetical protein